MKIGFIPEKLAVNLKPDILKVLSQLKSGQTVTARVIGQEQGGQVLLDILGSKLKLDLGRPLKNGDHVLLEVVKDPASKESPSLKLMDVFSGPVSKKHSENSEPVSVPKLAAKTRQAFQAQAQPASQARGAVIKAVLDRLPSFMEKNSGSTGADVFDKPLMTVPARVIRPAGNDRMVFSIKGEEIQAKMSSMIPEGKVVFLEKMAPGPSREFRIIQPDIAQSIRTLAAFAQTEGGAGAFPKLIGMMSRLLHNVKPDKDDVRHLPEPRLEKLMQVIENLSLKSGEPKTDFISRLVNESGISWENRLASAEGNPEVMAKIASSQDDIKGLIMDLLSDSSNLSPDIGKTLENALGSIENLQIMNRISTSEAGIFFLPFPIFFEGSFSFGQIFFDMPENSREENREKPYRVSIILNMTEIGKVRADISFLKKKISGNLIVSSEDVLALFADNLKELEENLLAKGFDAADLTLRLPRSDSELDSSSVFSGMVEKSDGLSILV